MYLRAGGMASSTRAAQFIKALTRIVWRVVGRKTSRRLVQWAKVNSGISSIMVLRRSTLLSSRQLSQACAPMATKCFGRTSVWMPVELRQPGASSLVLSCWVNPFNSDRGDGTSLTVTSARLMHPWKRYCRKLVSPLNTFTAPPDAHTRSLHSNTKVVPLHGWANQPTSGVSKDLSESFNPVWLPSTLGIRNFTQHPKPSNKTNR